MYTTLTAYNNYILAIGMEDMLILCDAGLSEGSRDASCFMLGAERGARHMDGHAGMYTQCHIFQIPKYLHKCIYMYMYTGN